MKTPEELILKLNELLEADQFDQDKIECILKQLKEHYKLNIKFLDFKYYNEYRRRFARKEKMKYVRIQDFETAAKFRNLEKECLNYISIKNDYNIEKSMFYYDLNYLFYFYFGKAKNDGLVREYLKEKGIIEVVPSP
ncbi:MAG: hypothetical protein LLG13_03725 [Bacteroidales bacterium]|nr:hypothetical protein [Bacteroidales bacterium]